MPPRYAALFSSPVVAAMVVGAPPPLTFDAVLLPYPPGNGDLSKPQPNDTAADRSLPSTAKRVATGLVLGAAAVGFSGATWPTTDAPPARFPAALGFALAAEAQAALLVGSRVAPDALRLGGLHVVVLLGPGGVGFTVAGTF